MTTASLTLPNHAQGASTDEAQVKQQANEITEEIESLISTINGKYQNMADLEKHIEESKEKIQTTRLSISETTDNISKRLDSAGDQLKSMQLKSVGDTPFANLLTANNMSDFFNRVYAISVLGSAQKEKLQALNSDQLSLEKLEKTLVETTDDLSDKKNEAKAEEADLDRQLAGLKEKLADNSSVLEGLARQRVEAENSKREAAIQSAAKLIKDKKKGKETPSENSDSTTGEDETKEETTSSQTDSSTEGSSKEPGKTEQPEESTELPKPTPVPEEKPSKPSGSAMSGQATAYTATGNLTATGTTPGVHRTIAVDPSVIPLGSSVKITVPSAPAYSGVYIAEDTGGVVHGHIIDIFVGSDSEAIRFGRRAIQFEVL